MARVLITGVSGFTGRYLAPKLAQAGYEVYGSVYGEDSSAVDGVSRRYVVDLGDHESVQRLVVEVAPDKVVHLAGISFVAHSNVNEIYHTNVVGTRNLLDALARSPNTPTAVLLASSANVYGNAQAGMLDESAPLAPANDYGVTKAATEVLAGVYKKHLPLIVVRPFNYTGRGQSEQFVIPKIVAHVDRREAEIELGNLDVARDFSDVRAVVDAYARLLEAPKAIGGTYNLCSGRATSLRAVIDLVRRISGHDFNVRVNPNFIRADDVKVLWGSPARVQGVIGPLTMPPLQETLRWMLKG